MTQSNSANNIKIIGITGNSGSGKSYIANKFALEENGFVISADEAAHKVMKPGGAAYIEIIKAFGEEILSETGCINRKILGAIVFSNKEKRELLEQISHKHIIAEIGRLKEYAKKIDNGYRYIIIDAPLLIEAGLHDTVDEVWVVNADVEKRLERVIIRDGISREDAIKRFSVQTPFEELAKYADRIIEN
ncbi:MAG: dephospho-CoA kinase [Defluviitaleaceae bacterium]|nr:dephospho-CoA kinase [Defluviitaleaceae bacterium]